MRYLVACVQTLQVLKCNEPCFFQNNSKVEPPMMPHKRSQEQQVVSRGRTSNDIIMKQKFIGKYVGEVKDLL